MSPLATVRGQTIWAHGGDAAPAPPSRHPLRAAVGRENIPPGAVLIAAKHQSAWDTMIFHIIARDPAIVMKAELLNIPVYGWYCRHSRMIPIDRDTGSKGLPRDGRCRQGRRRRRAPHRHLPPGHPRRALAPTPLICRASPPSIANSAFPVVPVALNSGVLLAAPLHPPQARHHRARVPRRPSRPASTARTSCPAWRAAIEPASAQPCRREVPSP